MSYLEIRNKIQQATSITDQKKEELLGLLNELEKEVGLISQKDRDQAESVFGFIRATAHEATREDKQPHLYTAALEGLAATATGFEQSHPRFVEVLNSICTALSNLGI